MSVHSTTSVLTLICFLGFAGNLHAQTTRPAERPLLITLDHNNDFVITGNGQQIQGINFVGPSAGVFETPAGTADAFLDPDTGELVGTAPAPFQITIAGPDSPTVTFGLLGSTATIDGSFPLQFGLKDLGLLDEVEVQIGIGSTPYDNPLDTICDDCFFPDVIRTPGGGIEVTNINEPITLLTIFSKDGGVLSTPTTLLPAGVSVVNSAADRLTLENPTGFDAASLADLDFLQGISSSQAVYARFTLADATSFGPFQISAAAVPEPGTRMPFLMAMVLCVLSQRRRRS